MQPTARPSRPADVSTDSARLEHKAARRKRWALVAALVFMTGLGMVLLFLLTLATRNRAFYEQNFAWLAAVNVAVAVLLIYGSLLLGATPFGVPPGVSWLAHLTGFGAGVVAAFVTTNNEKSPA